MSKEKDYIENIEGAERRFYASTLTVENRAEGDESAVKTVSGFAALYDVETDIGPFREIIRRGFFDDVLNNDVVCLKNHNPNYVQARSSKGEGTLSLSLDEKGLRYTYEVSENRQHSLDLYDEIQKGDVKESSFAFTVEEERWTYFEDDKPLRELIKAENIFDVSPVTYPAYRGTVVSARSLQEAKKENKKTGEDIPSKIQERKTVFEAQVLINKRSSK